MKFNILTTFAISSLLLLGCSGGSNDKDVPYIDNSEAESEIDKLYEKTSFEEKFEESFSFILPSPLEIASAFQRSGLRYTENITLTPHQAANFISDFDISLVFGIYSSDLAYNVLNGQSQLAIEYFKVLRDLSSTNGLEQIFNNEKLFNNFSMHIDNQDSILFLLGNVQHKVDKALNENNNFHKSVVYFTGAWIEGMYIGAKSISEENKVKVGSRLVEQLGLLESLLKGLKAQPTHKEQFKPLIEMFEDLQTSMSAVINEREKAVVDEEEFIIEERDVELIKTKVISIREYITKVES